MPQVAAAFANKLSGYYIFAFTFVIIQNCKTAAPAIEIDAICKQKPLWI